MVLRSPLVDYVAAHHNLDDCAAQQKCCEFFVKNTRKYNYLNKTIFYGEMSFNSKWLSGQKMCGFDWE